MTSLSSLSIVLAEWGEDSCFKDGWEYRGDDLESWEKVDTLEYCQEICAVTPSCEYFTYVAKVQCLENSYDQHTCRACIISCQT